MPELFFDVSDDVANKVKQRALEAGLSESKYLAKLVLNAVGEQDWPDGFFEEVVGGWQGGELKRPFQGKLEDRDAL